MEDAKVTTTAKAAEVRLGLVLYGGVSLAIYMNGVVNELFRAVRGRGPFFLLKELLNADIIVDIISGASAGGINGIFLGFALANEREFGTCAAMWRQDGALSTLLRKTNDLNGEVRSVLDSEHYQELLTRGFRTMWEQGVPSVRPLENPSAVPELDLFITGTNFYGSITHATDTFHHELDIKNHQTLFWLKHRQERKEQLSPLRDATGLEHGASHASESAGLLAFGKLAQITSCFPGAFASVRVGGAQEADEALADDKLRTWGSLAGGTHYFVDGGVLDNKPFTSTLNAIFYRTSRRPVCRHLLYLEPDPERFSKTQNAPSPKAPTFLRTIVDSISSIPSYESIALDLEAIRTRNQTLARFAQLEKLSELSGDGTDQAAAHDTDFYLRTRYLGLAQRVLDELQGNPVALIARRELEVAIKNNPPIEPALLTAIDVEYPLRRLMDLTYVLHDLEARALREPDASAAEAVERHRIWDYANSQIELLEVIRSALFVALAPSHELSGVTYFQWAIRKTQLVLDRDGLTAWLTEAPTDLGPLKRELERRSTLHPDGLPNDAPGTQHQSILTALNAAHEAFMQACDSIAAKRAFQTFPSRDRIRYPLQLASGIHELDRIYVSRLSPVDAQRGYCKRPLQEKLSGEALWHFGAFLKRSWRSNDILWGRLDGVCQLLETLLQNTSFEVDDSSANPASKGERPPTPLQLSRLRSALGNDRAAIDKNLAALFPSLTNRKEGATHLSPLAEWIHQGSEVNTQKTSEEFLNLLTHVAQLDILCEELPRVIADAAQDQLEWNQYAQHSEKADGTLTTEFAPGKVPLDPALIGASARQLAETFASSKSATELGEYFRNDYNVGRETLKDVPTTELAALGAQAIVVSERALTSGGRAKGFVTGTPLYVLIIRTPFRIISALASAVNRSPTSMKPVFLGSLLYLILAITMNICYAPLLYQGSGFGRGFALSAFVGVPITLIALLGIWVKNWTGRVLTLLFLLIIASTAFVATRESPPAKERSFAPQNRPSR